MLRSKSRSGYLEFGQKKHSSLLIRSISGSKICRGDALASQVDKQALVSVDRKSISLSENRIVKAAMMQKQLSDLEEELKNTKQRLNEAETELREAKELVNAGLSPKKAEQVFSELKCLKDSLSNSRKEIESRDKEMTSLTNRFESAKVFEDKLAEKDASLEESKKKIKELEDQLEKTKQSELNMLESLILQTQQIQQTKMDLEESKLEVMTLHEQLKKLQRGESMAAQKGNLDESLEIKALKDEITILKNELKFAIEAEEKSKNAMDHLASALREVATEASLANEKLRSTEEKVMNLSNDLELQTDTAERLRVEAEESHLAWTGKEIGFVSCIKKADEEIAVAKHENSKLKEALMAAETTTRIAREEAFKLRDLLKQAVNESNMSKEASNFARFENSELKDLLAEKEDTLHFLTKENERLRINEVAAHENVKEFKRLLAAKSELTKSYDEKEQNDVFNSPLSSLYEDHLDGRITPQKTFSFDLDELQVYNKDDMFEEDDDVAKMVKHDDPKKAEALKGSIFDTSASPHSEPQTPKAEVHHKRAQSAQFEEAKNNVYNSSNGLKEDLEDKSSYSKKKLFKKIGELIIGKNRSKKEGTIDQAKEQ